MSYHWGSSAAPESESQLRMNMSSRYSLRQGVNNVFFDRVEVLTMGGYMPETILSVSPPQGEDYLII